MLDAGRRCFASLFTDRAICDREAKGFEHLKVALSIGVQQVVRSVYPACLWSLYSGP